MKTVEGAAKVQKTDARQSPKSMAAVPKPAAELPHHRANVIVQFRAHDGELTGAPHTRLPAPKRVKAGRMQLSSACAKQSTGRVFRCCTPCNKCG